MRGVAGSSARCRCVSYCRRARTRLANGEGVCVCARPWTVDAVLRCCAHPPQPHACGMTWRPYDGRPSDVTAVVQSPPRCVAPRFSICRGARAEDSGMRVAVCGLAGGSAGVTIPSTHKSQRSLLGRERAGVVGLAWRAAPHTQGCCVLTRRRTLPIPATHCPSLSAALFAPHRLVARTAQYRVSQTA